MRRVTSGSPEKSCSSISSMSFSSPRSTGTYSRPETQSVSRAVHSRAEESEELARSLKEKMEAGGDAIWETEIFGKTLSDLVREGVSGKLNRLPEDARQKLRQALEKVINEGSGGMICIML